LTAVYSIEYETKTWDNLTTINYTDIKRWAIAINIADEKSKLSTTYIYNQYINNLYAEIKENEYRQILNKGGN